MRWVEDVDVTLLKVVQQRMEVVEGKTAASVVGGRGGGGGFRVCGESGEEPVVVV